MHTTKVLHKWLSQSAPAIHTKRLRAVLAGVEALTRGACATVTSLGRHVRGDAYDKHKIKRMDRLLSNRHLYRERQVIYQLLCQRLLQGIPEPVIIVDWSPLCADQSWQLLRASIPVGGRALTLYEEAHPRAKLGNRQVQHRFLDQLASKVPADCCPIVVADAGFKTRFYRYIESVLHWHWVGRIRGQDKLRDDAGKSNWYSAKSLYPLATTRPQWLGRVDWTQASVLPAGIVLVRLAKKRRQSLTLLGRQRQSKGSKTHASREREPWLLVTSVSLKQRAASCIKNIYRTRVQIEESFRDAKAKGYGLSQSQHRRMSEHRRAVLSLLVALATLLLWCIGTAGRQSAFAKRVAVNACRKRHYYSAIFLARLLVTQKYFRLPITSIESSLQVVKCYMDAIRYA